MLHCVLPAVFIIARGWKESRYPSTEEWIYKYRNVCIYIYIYIYIHIYTYTMKFYSAIKNNEFMTFLSTWMDLRRFLLSKVTQSQKNTHGIPSLIRGY